MSDLQDPLSSWAEEKWKELIKTYEDASNRLQQIGYSKKKADLIAATMVAEAFNDFSRKMFYGRSPF